MTPFDIPRAYVTLEDGLTPHSTLRFLRGFPQTILSTSSFSFTKNNKNPFITVSHGKSIETLLWYALYVTGYFFNEMLSVNEVDPAKRQESATAGKSGCRPSRADVMFAQEV